MGKKFLGMTIKGVDEHYRGQKRVPQLSQEEVGKLIHAVLNHDEVKGLAWTQYTPYFNDGEPCVFGVNGLYISLDGIRNDDWYADYSWMEDDADENNRYWVDEYNKEFKRLIGDGDKVWSGSWPNKTWEWKYDPDTQPNPSLFKAFKALNEAMSNDSCDYALLDLFGDHATIVIDKTTGKITVETYEHD